MKHFRIVLMSLACLVGFTVQAQVLPPDFICVSNDTLVWETPVNACGPFRGYLIYASQAPNGPFNLLTTVTNPAQTRFFHAGVTGQTWYYYLQSDFDCPGQPAPPSDTLDNRIPEEGPIRFATVESPGSVRISWDPSPSPEVFAYVISRQNASTGTTVLDTIFSGTEYLDLTASPATQAETYFVVAIDRCGNASLVPDPHRTVFLQIGQVDPCDQSITLNWTAYITWPGGVGQYVIYASAGGGPFSVAGQVAGDVLTATIPGLNDQTTYDFYVEAIRPGAADTARSNLVTQELDVVQPARDLVLANATVLANGAVGVNWVWNTNAELTSADLLRGTDPGNFAPVFSPDLSQPLQPDNNYEDATATPDTGPVFYRVSTVDQCDETLNSNVVGTIFLSGSIGADQVNRLSWTPYVNDLATIAAYDLYRITTGAPLQIASYGAGTRTHEDPATGGDADATRACYFVEARAGVALPDGSNREVSSRSNTICLEQRARVYIPNAFAPEGINRIFRPYLQFGEPANYRMVIYDRWGGQVFESQSIDMGWDGTRDGRAMPQGVYIYVIRFTQSGGREVEEKGGVFLMR